jgi:hypothetical protein
MFLFLRLLLAHFLGDFPFQFDVIFRLKLNGLKGIIPHALIILGCMAAMSWPYLNNPVVWFFIIAVSALHLIQDSVKLTYSSKRFSFWTYLLDQLFHVGTIAIIFLTDLKNLPAPQATNNPLVSLYVNDQFVLYLIMLIVATYNGHFMIRCFKDTFWAKAPQCHMHEKWYGIFERAVMVTMFFAKIPLVVILPVSVLLRPATYILFRRPLALHRCFIAFADMLLSLIIGLASGFALFLLHANYPIY